MDEGAGQGAQRKEGGGATANTGRKKRTTLQVNVCKDSGHLLDESSVKLLFTLLLHM